MVYQQNRMGRLRTWADKSKPIFAVFTRGASTYAHDAKWCEHVHLEKVDAMKCLRDDHHRRTGEHLPPIQDRTATAVIVTMPAGKATRGNILVANGRLILGCMATESALRAKLAEMEARQKRDASAEAHLARLIAKAHGGEFFDVKILDQFGIKWPPQRPGLDAGTPSG